MAKNKSIGWESSKLITDTAKEKIENVKNDPQWIALIALQFLLVLVLVGAIIIYLDVRFATIEFLTELSEPIPTQKIIGTKKNSKKQVPTKSLYMNLQYFSLYYFPLLFTKIQQ